MAQNPEYDKLLQFVCVSMGYCGSIKNGKPLRVDDFIPSYGMVTADQFVEWMILADNLNPNLAESSHKRAMKRAFIEHMGGDVVDASRLR